MKSSDCPCCARWKELGLCCCDSCSFWRRCCCDLYHDSDKSLDFRKKFLEDMLENYFLLTCGANDVRDLLSPYRHRGVRIVDALADLSARGIYVRD